MTCVSGETGALNTRDTWSSREQLASAGLGGRRGPGGGTGRTGGPSGKTRPHASVLRRTWQGMFRKAQDVRGCVVVRGAWTRRVLLNVNGTRVFIAVFRKTSSRFLTSEQPVV